MANLKWPVLNIRWTCMVQKPPHIWMLCCDWLKSQRHESSNCPHTPPSGSHSPLCMALLHSPIWKRNLVWLKYPSYSNIAWGFPYGWGTITYKTAIRKPCVNNRAKTWWEMATFMPIYSGLTVHFNGYLFKNFSWDCPPWSWQGEGDFPGGESFSSPSSLSSFFLSLSSAV